MSCAGLYDWPPFVIAPGFSVIGIFLMAAFENAVGIQLLGQTTLEEIEAAASAEDKIQSDLPSLAQATLGGSEGNYKLNP